MSLVFLEETVTMRLLFTLTLLVGVSVQETVKERITYNFKIWTNAAAHCAEFATWPGPVFHTDKADEKSQKSRPTISATLTAWGGEGR